MSPNENVRPVTRSTEYYLYFSKVLTKLHKYLGETKLYPISTTGGKMTKNASLNIKCKWSMFYVDVCWDVSWLCKSKKRTKTTTI